MIALGSHVTFTHRAAVARRQGFNERDAEAKPVWKWRSWELTEPKTRIHATVNGAPQIIINVTPIEFVYASELMAPPERMHEERWEARNKTIFCWPHEGSGVVVGLRHKQFGISHSGKGGTNMYGEDDWDPGYFEPFGQIALWVVKSELRGPEVYVPDPYIHLVHYE